MEIPDRPLAEGEIHELKRWNTPTLYNGWEQVTRRDYRRYLCSMKISWFLVVLAFPFAAFSAGTDVRFALPSAPLEIVSDESKFAPFAEVVGAEVERLIGAPEALDDPATLRLLLSTRVHLAHHHADNEKAIATAAWIRTLQSDPAGRAFAGLTTFAAVAARLRHPGTPPTDAAYRRTFLAEFKRQLEALPRTPEMTAFLRAQRPKMMEMTEGALRAEVRDVIEPAIARRGYCGLAEADQLVRVRHRLLSILPLRAETLQGLDTAIAAREGEDRVR